MLSITPISAFHDNYIWMINHPGSHYAWVVDPGDHRPVLKTLEAKGWELKGILLTHHHTDHCGGILGLLEHFPVPVYGSYRDESGLADRLFQGGNTAHIGPFHFLVLEIPGHTLDHIAFYGHGVLFCGDTLFSSGCGRIFEGTAPQMFNSLNQLRSLDDNTQVYCGHEYTEHNLKFALTLEPENADAKQYLRNVQLLRSRHHPSLPSTLGLEKKVNPFFRCDQPTIRESAERRYSQKLLQPIDVFAKVRDWKDHF